MRKTKTIPNAANIRATGRTRTRSPDHRVTVADPEAAMVNIASKVNLKASHSADNMVSSRAGSTTSNRVDVVSNRVDNDRAARARARAKERKARRLHLHSN